jgi:hypothetical protein
MGFNDECSEPESPPLPFHLCNQKFKIHFFKLRTSRIYFKPFSSKKFRAFSLFSPFFFEKDPCVFGKPIGSREERASVARARRRPHQE